MSIRMEDAGAAIMKDMLTCIIVSGVPVKPIRDRQYTTTMVYLFPIIAAKTEVCKHHVR